MSSSSNHTKNPLSLIGLEKHQADVYLSMLSLGNTTAQEISRKTGLKRPTVYVYLDELIKRGLVSKIPLNKKVFFKAVHIATVQKKVEESYKEFKDTLPNLLALSSNVFGKPQIEILEGEQGIISVYQDVIQAKSLRIWSDLGKVHNLFSTYFSNIAESIRRREITTREIITESKESVRYSKSYYQMAGPTYSARISSLPGIMNDNIIYDDTVTLFRMHDYNMFVVRIKDATIAQTMSVIFDMAWKSCKPLKDAEV